MAMRSTYELAVHTFCEPTIGYKAIPYLSDLNLVDDVE